MSVPLSPELRALFVEEDFQIFTLQGCRDILSLVFQRFHKIPTSSDARYTARIDACVKVIKFVEACIFSGILEAVVLSERQLE